MSDALQPRPDPKDRPNLPARRLTTEQIEAVVHRAVELQARDADSGSSAGVSEEELVRIGRELGITSTHMRRAMAEVATGAAPPAGMSERVLGPQRTSASRTVPGEADAVRKHIDRYLTECAYLAVLRRLSDRTVYEKSSGFQTELTRMMDVTRSALSGRARTPRVGAGFDLRTAHTVEVAVQPLDEGFTYVTFTADLSNQRTGYWVGVNVGAGMGATVMAAVAAIAIAPPAALIALPIMGASAWGTSVSYRKLVERAQLHLEALLDHLERGESLVPERSGGFGLRFG
jgi:hypothetical protein